MVDDPLKIIAVVSNLSISLGYVLIALWVVPKFDAAAPSWGLRIAKTAGLVFFVTCAMSHGEMALHAWTNEPMSYTAPHYLAIHVVQAVAAPVFLIFASAFLSIRLFDKRYYGGLLDRAIDEQAQRLAAMVREQDVKAVAHEARIISDAADLIHRAMGRDK